jgi:cytosine deaminase
LLDIEVNGARIAALTAAQNAPTAVPAVDLDGRHAWPTLIDAHAHLDKGHILDRAANADGTFASARAATAADRTRHWSHDDVVRRMTFGLRCAEAHGVGAIRTHLDSYEGQGDTTWAAFRDMRKAWDGRVTLQGVALVALDVYRGRYGEHLADVVAASGGILGGATRSTTGTHEEVLDDLDPLLDRLFSLAAERNLDLDLHVDESGDVASAALARVARAVLRHGYAGRVTCGHCCSLSLQEPAAARAIIELLAEARIAIISLPTVNMYLQDRQAGRTPRWRGVTPVKELRAAGVTVAVAGDNCRDPFYAYGDHDMLDTLRHAVRIMHLDHPFADMATLATRAPAAIMGLKDRGALRVGGPADLILFNARSVNELMCRPQHDRLVVRNGRPLGLTVPDYEELMAGGVDPARVLAPAG